MQYLINEEITNLKLIPKFTPILEEIHHNNKYYDHKKRVPQRTLFFATINRLSQSTHRVVSEIALIDSSTMHASETLIRPVYHKFTVNLPLGIFTYYLKYQG